MLDLSVHPNVLIDEAALRAAAARSCGLRPDEVDGAVVRRRSIDARGGKVRIQARVAVYRHGPPPKSTPTQPIDLPRLGPPQVAIVGAGPAGMFCAWTLARRGVASVVLERGRRVRPRRRDLAALSQRGELDPESNYCFGEGGAGTFSDGKLYTRSDKRGPVRDVLEAFVAYGASPDILVDARPHIGTNKLPGVITAMREHLEAAGVTFRFEARVDSLELRGGDLAGVALRDDSRIDVPRVVVAAGHSANDVLGWLDAAGVQLEQKPFAVGVRIEHPQSFVDRLQYGDLAGHPTLGAATYRLVAQACGAGVFSFCMCPGGYVVPATTQPGQQVVNGWSPSQRRGRFANSGFVTQVGPERIAAAGLDPNAALDGATFQRRIEQRAFEAGGGNYRAPAQTLRDFVDGRRSDVLPPCSYHRGVTSARLDELLGDLAPSLREALAHFESKMPGFVSHDAVALGVESRTSSPVRVMRDPKTLEAMGCPGLYPCGEGAGYAGGIVSAALDGMRVADAIADAVTPAG